MAGSLAQKIEKEYLSCCICFEELQDPIGLPCLHVFCYECLNAWYKHNEDQTYVTCPECKKPTQVPEEGIRGFPGHFLVKNLKETVHMEKMAAKLSDMTCSVCDKEAPVHCVDCNKSLCQQCQTNHDTFIKDHRVVTVAELQSGKVKEERRFCEIHNEQVRYYCETEEKPVCMDCISLKTCPIEHERVTLKEAAKKHLSMIDGLMKKCRDNKVKLQAAVDKNKLVLKDLHKSSEQSKANLTKFKQQFMQKVEQAVLKESDEIDKIQKARDEEIEQKQKALQSNISEIDQVCDQGSKLNESSSSQYLITTKIPSLSKKLNRLSLTQPIVADRELGYLKFESAAMDVPPIGHLLQRERWKLSGQFPTEDLDEPVAIAVNYDDDIAVACFKKGVRVYSKDGQVKHSFLANQTKISYITVSHDNRYIVANGTYFKGIQSFDNKGNYQFTVPVSDMHNKTSNVTSVAIDANGRIIAGLVENTISIHYAHGSLISKFHVHHKPLRLAVTSKGKIIVSSNSDRNIKLMDFSGANAKIVRPPAEVRKWVPGCMYCIQGQIFVENRGSGNPTGIYRYTADGDYLGCVTTEVSNPAGLALSQDGKEMFVAERDECLVKIFHRE